MSNSSCTNLSPPQRKILHTLLLSIGSFAFVCCVFVLATIFVFKKYRRTAQRVILYLFLTITLESATYMLHGLEEWIEDKDCFDNYCRATGFFDQVFSWMETMAIACLTFDLFFKVTTLHFRTERFEFVYVMLIFVFPLTFNWVPFVYDAYGDSGDYCWIKTHNNASNCSSITKHGYELQFGIFWIPYYLTILVVTVLYIVALCKARWRLKAYTWKFDPQDKNNKEMLQWELREYVLYPMIAVLLHSVALASRIANYAAMRNEKSYFSLNLLHSLFILLEGPLLTLMFFLNSDTRKDLCVLQNLKAGIIAFFCPCKMNKVVQYRILRYNERESDSMYSQEDGDSDASAI